jgi:hypothetical protein
MLDQIIQVGLDNNLIAVKKIIDYIARFEPFLERSVRDHLGFGDAIPEAIKFTKIMD